MKAGDPVWFRQTCVGGYGFTRYVPGEFVGATAKRVRVKLFRKGGDPVVVSVLHANVKPRVDDFNTPADPNI